VILLGATVGAGAGPAAALVSAGGGEHCKIGGWGTLVATVALQAAVEDYIVLGAGVDLVGSVSGIYRVGRRWVLQSGEAIATYIPADGSVISDVANGDELCDHNTNSEWTRRTVGVTPDWSGERFSVAHMSASGGVPVNTMTGNTIFYGCCPYSPIGTHLLYESVSVQAVGAAGTHDGTNHYVFSIPYILSGAVGDLGTTVGLSTAEYLYEYTVNQIFELPAAGDDTGLYSRQWRFDGTKVNAASNTTVHVGPAWCRLIAR
jgi:hypothetical protein